MGRKEWIGGIFLAAVVVGLGAAFIHYLVNRGRNPETGETEKQVYERMMSDPHRPAEDASIVAVNKMGGTFFRKRYSDYFQPVTEVSLHDLPVTDADLQSLKGLVNVESLDLSGTKVTDAGLAELKPLRQLHRLNLSRTAVTGAGLAELKTIIFLHDLNLSYCAVTDAGLAGLAGVHDVDRLDLTGTAVTNASLEHLKALPRLGELILVGTKVTGAMVKQIAGLNLGQLDLTGVALTLDEYVALVQVKRRTDVVVAPPEEPRAAEDDNSTLLVKGARPLISDDWLKSLAERHLLHLLVVQSTQFDPRGSDERFKDPGHSLDLMDSSVTDAGLRHLRDYQEFTNLRLTNTRVTDKGLAEVAHHPNLVHLDLSKTKVTDAGLHHLKPLSDLRSVRLHGANVTADGIAQLQAALPECEIKR
jgi:internalin A